MSKKLKENKIQWIDAYLSSLESSMTLTDDDLSLCHPLHGTFHRKAPQGQILDIGKARVMEYNGKFNKETKNWSINMNGLKKGMSCSRSCHNHNFARGGVYPIELIESNLPAESVVRENELVFINGVECEVIRCYCREITQLKESNITVGEALNKHGKDDLLLIEPEINGNKCSFSCYWDSKEHATICLREEMTVGYRSRDIKGTLTFADFNIKSWTLCEKYLGVRVSTLVLQMAMEGRNFHDSISDFDKDVKFVLNALMTSFFMVSIEAFDESSGIDDSISTLYEAKSLDILTTDQKKNICDTIDKYESEIFDWETIEWSTVLRPLYFEGLLTHDLQPQPLPNDER